LQDSGFLILTATTLLFKKRAPSEIRRIDFKLLFDRLQKQLE
jgi:hypothetical protein